MSKDSRKIGGHVSAAGGVDKAVERAHAIGANCVQVFSGSPRVWARAPLEKIDLNKLFSKQEELGVSPIFTHALYLTNVASENADLVRKSREALIYDLRFDALVKGSGVVVHLGSHQGRGWEAVKTQTAAVIGEVLAATPPESHFLIENSAGQQGKLCSDLTEIQWLLQQVGSDRLGWCFDTCHGWAAGVAYEQMIAQAKDLKILDSLRCIHVNGSRDPFGSGRDRHANIGEGEIPDDALAAFLNNPAVNQIPLITEVPGIDGEGPDAENIRRIKALLQ